MLKVFVAAIPENEAPEGLIPELQKDVALLAEDVVGAVPTLGEVLHFSFAHQGLESYSFTKKSFASYDSSQSLSLLAHRGVHPVVAVAGRSRKNGVDYDLIVKWVKKCDEYIEKYAVPDMNPMEKKNYDTLMGLLRSFGASVDATTRTLFIPAVGGNESMIVAAGRGKLKKIMMHYNGRWQEEEFAKEINIPQIGVAVRLNSALDFIKAVKQYAEAVRSLFNALKNEDVPPEFKSLTLPDPKTRSVAGGTMYYYDWPLEAGDDVFPCAILKGDLLVLATSKNLGESMLTKRAPPDCPVAGCDKPAGRICCIDLTECWSCLKLFSAALIDIMNTRGVFEKPDPQKALFIKQHIGALLTSLGALKRYSSSTIYKEGYEVTHSWLTVKDIGK